MVATRDFTLKTQTPSNTFAQLALQLRTTMQKGNNCWAKISRLVQGTSRVRAMETPNSQAMENVRMDISFYLQTQLQVLTSATLALKSRILLTMLN
jgi:hypothetical protein